MFRFMIIIDLWFMMNKITFLKCEAGLGYHLILECPHIGALPYTNNHEAHCRITQKSASVFEGHIWLSSFVCYQKIGKLFLRT